MVSENIVIHQPSLDEICRYGEHAYYSMVYQLTATPQQMKVQLWDMGIDYTCITPFDLFSHFLYRLYPREKTSILFGNLDFTRFIRLRRREDDSPILRQTIDRKPVIIDAYTYTVITDYLRQVHGIPKDERLPANESTKMILIEDDRAEMERAKNTERRS